MSSRLGLRLDRSSSYWSILRSQEFTYTFSHSLRDSPTFHIINPRNHVAKGDTLSVTLPASAVSGLSDEAILALLTRGFFGGWVFSIEGFIMRLFQGVLPAKYEALDDKSTKTKIWRSSGMPNDRLVSVGDMFFDFVLVAKHLASSNDGPSYVDYGFGSDTRHFSGCHRFVVERKSQKHENEQTDLLQSQIGEGVVELYLEGFRCNPMINQDSWAESLPWLHYWYAKFLWANAVKTVLERCCQVQGR